LGPDPHTGLWAGGVLPRRWVDAHVIRQGGIPPRRHLLSARMLSLLLSDAGFSVYAQTLPDVTAAQREVQTRLVKHLIRLYQLAKRLPGSRSALKLVGPAFYTMAQKNEVA